MDVSLDDYISKSNIRVQIGLESLILMFIPHIYCKIFWLLSGPQKLLKHLHLRFNFHFHFTCSKKLEVGFQFRAELGAFNKASHSREFFKKL